MIVDRKEVLKKFKGIHKGQRAFVVGCAPSFDKINYNEMVKEITFAPNRIYNKFVPKYYFSYDTSDSQFYVNEGKDRIKYADACFIGNAKESLSNSYNWGVSGEQYENEFFLEGQYITIGEVMLGAALWMECNPIYLVGIDFSYKKYDRRIGIEKYIHVDHFKGYETIEAAIIPVPITAIIQNFIREKNKAEEKGIEIFNVSKGIGVLEFFRRKVYEDLFK